MVHAVNLTSSDDKLLKRTLSIDLRRAKRACSIQLGFAVLLFAATVASVFALVNQPSFDLFAVFCGLLVSFIVMIFQWARWADGVKLVRLIQHQQREIEQLSID